VETITSLSVHTAIGQDMHGQLFGRALVILGVIMSGKGIVIRL